jgi:hypothetical protein
LLVSVPPGVVTVMLPVVAPAGTTAVTYVSETTVNVVASVPLKETAVESGQALAKYAHDLADGSRIILQPDELTESHAEAEHGAIVIGATLARRASASGSEKLLRIGRGEIRSGTTKRAKK